MKKKAWTICLVSALFLALSTIGCTGKEPMMDETTKPEETTVVPEETTAAEPAYRDPEELPLINPHAAKSGHISYLAIGQSLNVNSTHYLYDFLKEAGYEKVEVAVLYYSGCPLDKHYDYMIHDTPAYRLYFNGKGTWSITEGYTMDMALRMTDWDYISFNQGGGKSQLPETIEPYLTDIEAHVRQFQPNAHFFWNSFWAPENVTPEQRERFVSVYHDMTQFEVYEAFQETSQIVMKAHPELEFVVPAGSAIQNMRTSPYVEGTWLIRDYFHLSYDYGYYLGAMVLAKSLGDIDIDASTFIPPGYEDRFTPEIINGLKTAVKDAFEHPWSVTENPYR